MTSSNGKKGYKAEHDIELILQGRYAELASNILRPRAGASTDKGDIHGLPVVISIKDWAEPALSLWLREMNQQCVNSGKGVGVVWHKRRGKGSPLDWYVTTDQQSMDRLLDKFSGKVMTLRTGVVVSSAKLAGWMRILTEKRGDADMAYLIHNRVGGEDTYLTMYGEDFLVLLDAYVLAGRVRAGVV